MSVLQQIEKTGFQRKSFGQFFKLIFILFLLFAGSIQDLRAEGSVDFIGYDGYRLFLDTRDSQQMKVYAKVGEFINVGASHVGVMEGYIRVFRPDGTLHSEFNNTGNNVGLATIFNSTQEQNGPTGGGTTQGLGYEPGVVAVEPGQEGIWTVRFDYPTFQLVSFQNIMNSAPWTQAIDQPNTRRVVLAWDITVSADAPGNMGGECKKGRVYSNEYISLINQNTFTTSPTFYVLTEAGWLYKVDFFETDPFRFPISSNSVGITDGAINPIYKSKDEDDFFRSADPNLWNSLDLYLYEPQAKDFGPIINNKVFFNPPDPTMPAMAPVSDIYRSDPHQTWLFSVPDPVVIDYDEIFFIPVDPDDEGCEPGTMQTGAGGFLVFNTSLAGTAEILLDLNNDGDYDDSVDVVITQAISSGLDSIFWNGLDGLSNPIPIQQAFTFNYNIVVRTGESHIAVTDVEYNQGGITIILDNGTGAFTDSLFFYDHSDIGNDTDVSGGGTPGNALPTSIPFTYGNNFGNNRFLDYWAFVEFAGDSLGTIVIDIVEDCVPCGESNTPVAINIEGGGDYCTGDNITLSATNDISLGFDEITYTWTGPNGFFFQETTGPNGPFSVTISNAGTSFTGDFELVLISSEDCPSEPITVSVTVHPNPNIANIAGGGNYCEGDDIFLTALNSTAGAAPITYTWAGPNSFSFTNTVNAGEPLTASVLNASGINAGEYTLSLTSAQGCIGTPESVDVIVNPNPSIEAIQGEDSYCEGESTTLTAINNVAGINAITYTWTGPNGFFFQGMSGGNGPFDIDLTNMNLSMDGEYCLTIISDGGCEAGPVCQTITVNPNPSINSISASANEICSGEEIQLTGSNNVAGIDSISYTWTGPDNFFFTSIVGGTDPLNATVVPIGINGGGDYTLSIVSNDGCIGVDQSVTVTVNPTPEISGFSGGAFCAGTDVTIGGVNNVPGITTITYTWTGPNGFTETGNVGGNDPVEINFPSIDSTNAGEYTLTFTSDADCVSATDTINVQVNSELIVTDLTGDGIVCENNEIVLSASNSVAVDSVTYTWTGPDTTATGTTVGTGPFVLTIPSADMDDAGDYTLTLISNDGCVAAPVTVTIEVEAELMIIDVTGDGAYCEGDTLVLSGSNSVAVDSVTYTWTGPDTTATGTTVGTGPFVLTIPNLDQNDAGDYTLTIVSTAGCEGDPVTVNVAVNEIVNATDISQDTTVCEGEDIILTASNSNGGVDIVTYTWTGPNYTFTGMAPSSGPFDAPINDITLDNEGVYTLNITTAAGCQSESEGVNVDVLSQPIITDISGGGAVCEIGNATLSATNGAPGIDSITYTWTGPGGFIFTQTVHADSTFDVTLMPATPGQYDLVLVSNEGCVSDTQSVVIELIPAPVIEITTPGPVEACEGIDLLLEASGTGGIGTVTYTWTGPNGDIIFTGTAPASGPFDYQIPDIQIPDSGLYILNVLTQEDCPSEPDSILVNVNPTPIPSQLSGGGIFCQGDTVKLIFWNTNPLVDSLYYTCFLPPGGSPADTVVQVAAGTDTITICLPDITIDQAGTIQCSMETFDGCGSSLVTATVDVIAIPEIIDIDGGGPYCADSTAMLTAQNNAPGSGTVTYTWTGPDGDEVFSGTAPWEGPFDATVPNPVGGEYCLVLETAADCESDTACVTIVVNPVPELIPMEGGGTYCEGDTVIITTGSAMLGFGELTYTCTGPDGLTITGTIADDEPLTIEIFGITLDQAGTYSCTITSSEGCESDEVSAEVIVEITPVIIFTMGDTTVCEDSNVLLSATNSAGNSGEITYTWLGPDGSVVFIGTAPSAGPFDLPINNITPAQAGTYTLQLVSEFGCESDQETVEVTVNPLPIIQDFSEGGMFCEGDEVTLTADIQLNGNASVDYEISGPAISETGTLTQDDVITVTFIADNASAGTYTLTVTSEAGCEATPQSLSIEIITIEAPNITASPDVLCQGEELLLETDDYGPDATYEWFHDGNSLETTTVPMLLLLTASSGEYTVVVSLSGCAESSGSTVVTVFTAPEANDDSYEIEFNTTLSGVNILDNDSQGQGVTITVLTSVENGELSIDENGNLVYTPNANFAGTEQITYRICSIDCPDECDEAIITIVINDIDCFIPNVITPNDDGSNELFIIPCLENENFPQNVIRIFNRWGDEIYVAEPYLNDWKGTNDDKPLPAGTYFYLLQLRPGDGDPIQGFITIAR